MNGAVFHVKRHHAHTVIRVIHDKIQRKILNEKVAVKTKRAAVKSVEQSVACAVGSTCAAVCLRSFAVVERLPTESPLVDFAFFSTGERESVVLKLQSCCWSLAAHVVDRILVSKPVTALYSVVHVPSPIG